MDTVNELLFKIYDDNYSHIDFMENMGGDCDCNIHITLDTLANYIGIEVGV